MNDFCRFRSACDQAANRPPGERQRMLQRLKLGKPGKREAEAVSMYDDSNGHVCLPIKLSVWMILVYINYVLFCLFAAKIELFVRCKRNSNMTRVTKRQ